jgi:hypothetical protein
MRGKALGVIVRVTGPSVVGGPPPIGLYCARCRTNELVSKLGANGPTGCTKCNNLLILPKWGQPGSAPNPHEVQYYQFRQWQQGERSLI